MSGRGRAGGGAWKWPGNVMDPPRERGGSVATGTSPVTDLAGGLGGWRLRGLHRVAGGLPLDVDTSLHGLPPGETDSRKTPGFYEEVLRKACARLKRVWKVPHFTRKQGSRRHSSESQDFQICHVMLHASPGARGPAPPQG